MLRTAIWQELQRLRSAGVTVIVTTQYVAEAEYCDSVALISEGDLVALATPGDLRKMALGGDVIEVETRDPIDATRLPQITDVVSVRQTGPRSLLVVAADAGLASPRVNDAIESVGNAIESSREYRPTFDEVFAALVTAYAARRESPPVPPDAPPAPPEPPMPPDSPPPSTPPAPPDSAAPAAESIPAAEPAQAPPPPPVQ